MSLRSEVFVSEQYCVYTDPDHQDLVALHLICKIEARMAGYMRIIKLDSIHFGRIVVQKDARNRGMASTMIKAALDWCKKNNHVSIEMSAQLYLSNFYTKLGFHPQGSMYLEDGIPHLKMVYQEPLI